ncbi:MAG: hypothetical protein WBG38_10760 [Nodosilinea sp.]
MTLQVYGIPTCGSCTQALLWLNSRDVSYEFINTKDFSPSPKMVAAWVEASGRKTLCNTSG